MSGGKTVSMIVAVSENGVIGRDGDMPWRLSADLKNFRSITSGHTIIMGRKTWDSIGRLLPGRQTVIVTRQNDFEVEGAIIASSLEEALNATSDPSPFIVGGAEIYRIALPIVDRIYLTRVHATIHGDTWLPNVDFSCWSLLESQRYEADGKNSHPYSFEVYEKQPSLRDA